MTETTRPVLYEGGMRKPTEKEIADAIKHVTIRVDDVADTSGVAFDVATIRTLTMAARYALELLDFDNLPLLREDLRRMKKRPNPVKRAAAKRAAQPEAKP